MNGRAYYNEIDPYCVEWLRNLIAADLIAPGDVDGRDIREVKPSDLVGYTQCHFFAGIAGWSLALSLAGWSDDRPVWTGSCPCQPFSAAGKGKASSDERHLWPEWFRLIRTVRPPVIFGEQVEAAIGWGWLDLVHSDLEEEGYAVGAAVLPACSVGAPHIRQRLWFVADANGGNASTEGLQRGGEQRQQPQDCGAGELADPSQQGERGRGIQRSRESGGEVSGHEAQQRSERCSASSGAVDASDSMGNAHEQGSQGRSIDAREHAGQCSPWAPSSLIWLPCTDGKQRPTQPGIFPLAHGVSNRVAKLRAAGNSIVPQAAAEFIRASMT